MPNKKQTSRLVAGIAAAIATVFMLVGCGGTMVSPGTVPPSTVSSSSSPIQHVVVLIQENRSFDDLFATFPNANGARGGCMKGSSGLRPRGISYSTSGGCPGGDTYIKLAAASMYAPCDFRHGYHSFLSDYDNGKMDGFNLEGGSGRCHDKSVAPYQYVNPKNIAPYWDMAKQYVLADNLFQTQGSGSFTAHQDLIAGGTSLNGAKTKTLVDLPTTAPWGCDAPPNTKTSLLVDVGSQIQYEYGKGPYPCLKYATMRDLLDAKSVTWKYYSPPVKPGTGGAIWNAFDAIKAVRYGPEWGTNVTDSDTQIFDDISGGTLPAVSWVIPDSQNSDHPEISHDGGPAWVASIVNAIGQSSYWDSTAIIVVWDDWGGFYDHVPPPFFDKWGGLGFRVPMIVISAYALGGGKKNYVSHTQYEFGSVLKFVEDTFDLGSLGNTDKRATSMVDCFDFTQHARSFKVIPSEHDRTYFEHQRPSYQPVDTE